MAMSSSPATQSRTVSSQRRILVFKRACGCTATFPETGPFEYPAHRDQKMISTMVCADPVERKGRFISFSEAGWGNSAQ